MLQKKSGAAIFSDMINQLLAAITAAKTAWAIQVRSLEFWCGFTPLFIASLVAANFVMGLSADSAGTQATGLLLLAVLVFLPACRFITGWFENLGKNFVRWLPKKLLPPLVFLVKPLVCWTDTFSSRVVTPDPTPPRRRPAKLEKKFHLFNFLRGGHLV